MNLSTALARYRKAQAAAAKAVAAYERQPEDVPDEGPVFDAYRKAMETLHESEASIRWSVVTTHGLNPLEVVPKPVAVLAGDDLAVVAPRFEGDSADFLAIVPSSSIVASDAG